MCHNKTNNGINSSKATHGLQQNQTLKIKKKKIFQENSNVQYAKKEWYKIRGIKVQAAIHRNIPVT
jgi:hypothetical protein